MSFLQDLETLQSLSATDGTALRAERAGLRRKLRGLPLVHARPEPLLYRSLRNNVELRAAGLVVPEDGVERAVVPYRGPQGEGWVLCERRLNARTGRRESRSIGYGPQAAAYTQDWHSSHDDIRRATR